MDFVVRAGRTLTAIEVKSGRWPDVLPGLDRFRQAFRKSRPLLVDRDGIGLEEFLMKDTYLEVTFRRGPPIAAYYYYLPRRAGQKSY